MNNTLTAVVVVGTFWLSFAHAQEHDQAMHMQHMQHMMQDHDGLAQQSSSINAQAPVVDGRQIVHFPTQLREHTLANMRDHLLALQQIQEALGKQEFDRAGDIAEQRLGMSSLTLHGAHEVAKYMPEGMQAVGTAMHRNASRLALAVRDAAATNDMKPVFEALSNLSAQCVACHAGYRVR